MGRVNQLGFGLAISFVIEFDFVESLHEEETQVSFVLQGFQKSFDSCRVVNLTAQF